MTLLLYARRKKWLVKSVKVEVTHEKVRCNEIEDCGDETDRLVDVIHNQITLDGDLTEDQRKRLEKIAGMCHIHETLVNKPRIRETVKLL